ncbi:MAG: energy transducer TonB [Gammaproteobacteria bacterium]|nr:energy transducer TonB [Gammaproteobacteria bacterium]
MTTMAAQPPGPTPGAANITSGDRLGLTIFFAIVIHSLIIMGISFSQPERQKHQEKLPGLEITLAQSQSENKIDDADFLAQANQEGGGDSKKVEKSSSPSESVIFAGDVGEVTEFVPETQIATSSEPQHKEILTATRSSEHKIAIQQSSPDLPTDRANITSKQLLKQSKVMARLSAEVDVSRKVTSNQPKKKFITAQTKEYRFASYEESWRKKVERIGTLNFPDAAIRTQLTGNLRMSVTIRADGSVKSIKITKYSGHKTLDDAALRIVKMAAPYARFPDEISKDYDEIVIVRTWQFLSGKRLKTKR